MCRKKVLCQGISISNVPVKFVEDKKNVITVIVYTESDEELFFLTPENAKLLHSKLVPKAPYSRTIYSFYEPNEVELEIIDMNNIKM